MINSSTMDIMWIVICSGLVLIMQGGFLCLESGLTRSKNSINVAMKNLADMGIAVLVFWLMGFGLMFGLSHNGLFGTSHYAFSFDLEHSELAAFFLFQTMFCATASTIVSGAVAERMRFSSYLIVTLIISSIIYPIFGHWVWGGQLGGIKGWLAEAGFIDFAGSSVVHSVGGWVALAILLVIGPRIGRFDSKKSPSASSLPTAMLGVLLLFFGWFGFNGGSALAMNDMVPGIIVNTALSGCASLVSALILGWLIRRSPDVRLTMNGLLAGLVAVTANCHMITSSGAIIVGLVAGIIMVLTDLLLEKKKIDDAVGAVPVHLTPGIWGTLAVALFARPEMLATGMWAQFEVQLMGIILCCGYAFGISFILFTVINILHPLRVSKEDEYKGLNVAEHNEPTEVFDLLIAMDHLTRTGDLSNRVPVEPFTEVGQIAEKYNHVIDSLQKKDAELRGSLIDLEDSHEQLKNAQVQLLQSEKLSSIGQLAAGVAHEINNPVGYISSNIQILEEYIEKYQTILMKMDEVKESVANEDMKKAQDLAHDIEAYEEEVNFDFIRGDIESLIENSQDGADRVRKIVSDLRNFSREGVDGEMEMIKVCDLVESVLSMVQSEVKSKANLQTDYDESIIIRGYPQRLGQVLINLIINATQSIDGKGLIKLAAFEKDGSVLIEVSDNGSGIEEEKLSKIFDPFYTTKPVGVGTGLGLSICYEIIKKHNGSLDVKSVVGQGTTFSIILPKANVSS